MSRAVDSRNAVNAAAAPIVVDIGKKRKKQIKRLSEGRGPLMDEVNELLAELQANGSIAANVQPVVIVVKRKRKARVWPVP